MIEAVQPQANEPQGISKFYYSAAEFNIFLEQGIKTEIIEKTDVFPIPHAPDWCQGMISLRGKLIPVVDVNKLLNTNKQSSSNWLLVLEKDPYPQLAFRIDKLPQQQFIEDQSSESTHSEELPSWLKSSLSIAETKIYHADHTELFDQLIQENEASVTTNQDVQSTPNPDSSGNDS